MPVKPAVSILTKEEQAFAEENHNFVYFFLNRNKLDIDEWYDVAVFGYLRAVRKWHQEPGLRNRWKFTTIASMDMRNEVGHELRQKRAKRRTATVVSLQELIYAEQKTTREEVVPAANSIPEECGESFLVADLEKILTDQQLFVARLLMQGYKQAEIARTMGTSQASIYHHITRIRNKLKKRMEAI